MKKITHLFLCGLFLSVVGCVASATQSSDNTVDKVKGEKTLFQTADEWQPELDVRSDVAIVYYTRRKFDERMAQWKQAGYRIHFMCGIAWGEYQDYFDGTFDGKTHYEDGQVERSGDTIWHGPGVPYNVPSEPYLKYIKSIVKRAIDNGAEAVHLEEPEFWARAGYSGSFKNEWKSYYGFDWMPQHESPEATYLANKLKYELYYRALNDVFNYIKAYGKEIGRDIKCYVPTHSLANYSAWRIVSPEASLASLPGCDGYIAQVWTGTSKEPLIYNGVEKSRIFENAYVEYGSMVSMTAPTGRRVYFLTDPIEDRPLTWEFYKRGYEATFTAKLLYPMVNTYEVMPWPGRIYLKKYKLNDQSEPQPISPAYATQMQVMINALNDMPLSENRINGSHGLAVLMSNSLMFQRFPTHAGYEDPQLSNFYGLLIPFLKRGVPIATTHIENSGYEANWKDIRVLLMSYSNMKPLSAEYHTHIADWVRGGGVLVYCGRDNDPFQQVKEWWNSDGMSYKAPVEHLFEQLGVTYERQDKPFRQTIGKGVVYVINRDPKEFVLTAGADASLVPVVEEAYKGATGESLQYKNHLLLERGNYDIAAVMDESVSADPLVLKGTYIDLFDPELPAITSKTVLPDQQAFLYNVGRVTDKKTPKVLCGASRVYDEVIKRTSYQFTTKSPDKTINVSRVLLPSAPTSVTVTRQGGEAVPFKHDFDSVSSTLRLKYDNRSEGIHVEIRW